MKKLLTILLCLPLLIMAQAPQGFTYQGVATDNNGFELQNQTISIQASILSSSATGTTVWQETHTTSTDTFGLFNVVIGEGISTNGGSSTTFQEIDWGAASHFMKVEIDVNGGSNYVHVGTSQMMSVPYALYAENVHNLNMDSILGAVYDSINTSFSSGAMSVSTFGDTLTLNGQSIIIAGISYQNTPSSIFGTVTDINLNTYQTVTIGNQEWMTEDLRVTNFSNGNSITLQTSNSQCAIASYRDPGNGVIYYNGIAAVDTRNICPTGWRVPSKSDYEVLLDVFGDYDASQYSWIESGAALKSTDQNSWDNPLNSTNASHLNMYPTGMMYCSSNTVYSQDYAENWTISPNGGGSHYVLKAENNTKNANFLAHSGFPSQYFSTCRCIKD